MDNLDTPKNRPVGRSLRSVFPGVDWHPADIKAAMEKAGWSFRRLSFHHGFSTKWLCVALRRPSPAAEGLIAEAIGRRPQEIWPSRYDAQGRPRGRVRRSRVGSKYTEALGAGHVSNREAA